MISSTFLPRAGNSNCIFFIFFAILYHCQLYSLSHSPIRFLQSFAYFSHFSLQGAVRNGICTSSVITSNWRRIYLTLAHSVLPDIKCWLCLPFHGFIYSSPSPETHAALHVASPPLTCSHSYSSSCSCSASCSLPLILSFSTSCFNVCWSPTFLLVVISLLPVRQCMCVWCGGWTGNYDWNNNTKI